MTRDINRLAFGHCFREAGAGGSNPLTPTSVSAVFPTRRTVFRRFNEPESREHTVNLGVFL